MQAHAGDTSVEATTAKQNKRTIEGGVVVEDVKEGHGPEAKPGKLVSRFFTIYTTTQKKGDSILLCISSPYINPFYKYCNWHTLLETWNEDLEVLQVQHCVFWRSVLLKSKLALPHVHW